MNNRISCFFILIFTSLNTIAQVLPTQRQADWPEAGITDSTNYDQQTINVLNLGAANDSSAFSHSIIQQALNNLQNTGGTVWMPPGVYLIGQTLQIPSGVRLKGAGSDSTRLIIKTSPADDEAIIFHGQSLHDTIDIKNGFTKHSDSLLVNGNHGLQTGDFVEIIQNNGTWDTQPATWAKTSVGMISQVTQVNGCKIILRDGLSMDLTDSLNPRIIRFDPLQNAAVACLKLRRLDTSTSGTGHNISMVYAWNCRAVGIESTPGLGSHVYISKSAHNSIYGNYIHHSNAYDGTGTHGYGITINHHACYNLIQNNILQHLRHALMCKTGANTNVFGYNYSREVYRTELPHDASGDISLHGHYAFANLFEGNIVQNIVIDHYWGASGPYNTFFRNRGEHYGIIMTMAGNETDKQNFIGNEVSFGSGGVGQYVLTGNNHFEHGNNVQGNTMPPGTSTLNDSSYYLEKPPGFWNYSEPWPSIGYPNTLGANKIPATIRYQNGGKLTLCECSPIDNTGIRKTTQTKFTIYPNPARSSIQIKPRLNNSLIRIYSSNGQLLQKKHWKNSSAIDISMLKTGMYLLVIETDDKVCQKKFIKISPQF